MSNVSFSQKEADRLMKIPGTQKGAVLRSHLAAIKNHAGEEGLAKIEKALVELGYPVTLQEVRATKEYPEAQTALISLLCQKLLGYTDADIFVQAVEASKLSFFSQLLMRTFTSLERVLKNAPHYWKKHVSIGDLECSEFNKKEKFAIIRLRNYKLHPVVCLSLAGYFVGMFRYVQPSANIKETKCIHKGDQYHEFKVTW
ncbi:MAG: hypothetical protein PHE77_03945 [Candidatus Pacebacteria bacterium]|nr:hypothetical protein [Candidatus Paceibacterota bacterium]